MSKHIDLASRVEELQDQIDACCTASAHGLEQEAVLKNQLADCEAKLATELSMVQGARLQYRASFKAMATCGGNWCLFREHGNFSGVVLAYRTDRQQEKPLLENVQAMSEETMAVRLSEAIRKSADTDTGYLHHGKGTKGPFRTESVKLRYIAPNSWFARFEGKWRKVHVQVNRTFIVFQGEKIDIQIFGGV